ncbi:ATP-binding cassette domain-containing protein [Streptobacillus moniliformis]|uniref:ATP-binding cassette domain-containing protein n=1 Tax=Streptobacillus moniliformis TaxID=34105 RepID=UPI0007E34D2E|nr:ABC transporter ATP-binding protein [Streptobacillus moniliformis]
MMKIIKLCREIKVYYIWLLALIFSILEFLIARGIIKLEENFNTKNISFLLLLILLLSLIGYYLNKKIYLKEKEYKQKINTDILTSLTKKEYMKIDEGLDGEIMTLLISDSDIVSKAYISDLTKIVIGILSFIAVTVFGFLTSISLTVFSLILCPVSLLIFKYISDKIEKSWKLRQESQEDSQQILQEIFVNKIHLKILKSENFAIKLLKERYVKFLDSNYENSKLQWQLYTLSMLSGLLFDSLNLMFSFYLILNNKLTIGGFIGFSLLIRNFTWIFYELPNNLVKIKQAIVSFERINEFIHIENIDEFKVNNISSIKLENITFSYIEGEEVLKDISFEVNGEKSKISILGKSGSGKSTLLKILLGLYKPNKGNIFINDKKVDILPKNIFNYVPQKIELFPFSIKENILMGRNISEEKLNEIIEKTNLKEFIDEKGLDYEIKLNEDINLSSGQIQKIGIARALIEDKILIFDEPFANVDNETEDKISKLLYKINLLVILISHRDSKFIQYSKNILL